MLAWGNLWGCREVAVGSVGWEGHTEEPRTSMLLICCRMWHCCPSPPALRSLSSIAETSPCATLVQKVSGPWMNSLWGRGAGWAQSKPHSSAGIKGMRQFCHCNAGNSLHYSGGRRQSAPSGVTRRTGRTPLPRSLPMCAPHCCPAVTASPGSRTPCPHTELPPPRPGAPSPTQRIHFHLSTNPTPLPPPPSSRALGL